MSDELPLSEEEVHLMIRKLQMKFGTEGKQIQNMIENDIRKFGHLSYETKQAKKQLKAKILAEKKNA